MAELFKRKGSPYYWFDFMFHGERHQHSTYCTNKEAAKTFVAAYRTRLAHNLVGIVEKQPAPLLRSFLEGPFWSNVAQHITKPGTLKRYRLSIARLCEFEPFKITAIDAITQTSVDEYAKWRKSATATSTTQSVVAMKSPAMPAPANRVLSPATINSELRCLRKALRYAARCKLIHYAPFSTLPGERNREFVLTGEMEKAYLAMAVYPLHEIAVLMLDLGLRPEEAVSLRKADISSQAIHVAAGKTANAVRTLPQTTRSRTVVDFCNALFPSSEFVFPGRFPDTHLTVGAVTNLHRQLRRKHGFPPEFALYSMRHTHATRFAESGASVFEIKARLGHSSVKVSERYVHSTAEHMTLAARRFEAYSKMLRGEGHEDTSGDEKRTGELRSETSK